MGDIKGSVVVTLITKNTYHLVWGGGIDFDRMLFKPKYNWKTTDGGVVLRFNNSEKRELYESSVYYGSFVNTLNESYKGVPKDRLASDSSFSNMKFGQMVYDNETKVLDLFVSGNENASSI